MTEVVARHPAVDWAAAHRRLLAVVIVVLGVATAVLLVLRAAGSERRALARMPADDRRAFYETTLDGARATCRRADREPAFRARCADAARFVSAFPECDASCRAFASAHTREPAR